ncbi:FAD-binding protein [Raoultibacter phocaeensis]|uniref:FAD-binding protein n=1 Tax=Raoultibacter phocaeensis TaxID=2479841 RepID=UPI0015D5BE1B|nr:FAD-binding protein [Raoultibacter phocaeensis]
MAVQGNDGTKKRFAPTRRDFLKGAAAFGIAASFAGVASGCSQGASAETGTSDQGEKASQGQYAVSVFEGDVLIIGAGVSGITAARKALDDGADLMIVDKGPWGHCGSSGINWGHDLETNEWFSGPIEDAVITWTAMNNGLCNQTYDKAVLEGVRQARPSATAEQVGSVLQRGEDGEPIAKNADSPMVVDHGYFLMWHARDIAAKGARIYDRVFILDLLLGEDGSAAGAVGINLVTGEAYVFHAKSVILATGSYVWAAGYNGQGAYSIGSPENTGDGYRMLLDAGVPMRDMEQIICDVAQWYPKGCRQGMGNICGSITTHNFIFDKDKQPITELVTENGWGFPEMLRMLAKADLDGRTLEVEEAEMGGFYVSTECQPVNRYYARVGENYERGLGYDIGDYVIDVFSQWDCAGMPSQLSEHAETSLPGVYFSNAGEGAWSGCALLWCVGTGWIAGEGAASRAKTSEYMPIPWDKVRSSLDEAFGLLAAEPADKKRALEVFRNIQKAYWKGLQPARSADGLNECLKEIDRIEAEEIPNMYVASKSKQLNSDWQRALEAKSLLAVTRATAHAALAREESRGHHCRIDFPKMDSKNWLKNTNVTCTDGTWSVELTDIDDAVCPAETVASMMSEYGMEA